MDPSRPEIDLHQDAWSTTRAGLLLATLSVVLTLGTTSAAEPVDKSGFTLFKPTPTEHLREFSTDRPDKTESPYTVDAGHFQIEMDLVTYERDRQTGPQPHTLTESWGIAPVNIKVGLCNQADFQLVFDNYSHVRVEDRTGQTISSQGGFGDITARLKANLWGNDGGPSAFGVMPFVKLPSNQDHLGNHAVEGGLILPLALDLGHDLSLGLMSEFDFMQNAANTSYHAEFVNSITLGADLVGELGGYVEFWSLVSAERDSPWQGTVDVGLTYGLTPNIQLDGGINVGVTRSAADLQPFIGVSFRF